VRVLKKVTSSKNYLNLSKTYRRLSRRTIFLRPWVLTTSKAEEDIFHSYALGASSLITKPVSLEGLVELMKAMGQYWIEFVELPS